MLRDWKRSPFIGEWSNFEAQRAQLTLIEKSVEHGNQKPESSEEELENESVTSSDSDNVTSKHKKRIRETTKEEKEETEEEEEEEEEEGDETVDDDDVSIVVEKRARGARRTRAQYRMDSCCDHSGFTCDGRAIARIKSYIRFHGQQKVKKEERLRGFMNAERCEQFFLMDDVPIPFSKMCREPSRKTTRECFDHVWIHILFTDGGLLISF